MTTRLEDPLKLSMKRKKNMLTIKEKLELIEKYETGTSATKLAKEYCIGVQTVRDISKNKSKLEKFARDCDSGAGPSRRKSMKKSTYENLDIALLQWFNQQRAQGVSVTGPMCTQKAKLIHDQLGLEGEFSASSGWLTRFKQRYGIRELSGHGEKSSTCIAAADSFIADFQKFVTQENLQPDQIYSADEVNLYWKSLPTRIHAYVKEEYMPKTFNDRLTLMCCGNASGNHKLKLVMVGMAKNPRSFKGNETGNLPVCYYNDKGLKINREIFKNWFQNVFVPEIKSHLKEKDLKQKAILLMFNTDSYSYQNMLESDDGLVIVKFLPPNTVSLIQPTDQRVSSILKKQYRANILKTYAYKESGFASFWKNLTILDAIYGVSLAWSEISPVSFVQSWKKLLPDLDNRQLVLGEEGTDVTEIVDIMKNIDGFQYVNKENVNEWLKSDLCETNYKKNATNIAIVDVPCNHHTEEEVESEEELGKRIDHSIALHCVDTLLKYLNHWNYKHNDAVALKKIRTGVKRYIKISKNK